MNVVDGNHNRDFTAQRAIGARIPKIVSELEQDWGDNNNVVTSSI